MPYSSLVVAPQNVPFTSIHIDFVLSWWIDFDVGPSLIDSKDMIWIVSFATLEDVKRKYNSQLPSKNKNAFQSDAYFPFVYRQGGSFMGHPSWNPPSWHPLHGNPFTAPLHRTPLHGTPSQIPLHGTHFMAPPSWKPPLQHPLHSTLSQNSLHRTSLLSTVPLLRTAPPAKDGTVQRTELPLWTDKHLWKHYFPATSFVGGNNLLRSCEMK